jgi:hypothetical protein
LQSPHIHNISITVFSSGPNGLRCFKKLIIPALHAAEPILS